MVETNASFAASLRTSRRKAKVSRCMVWEETGISSVRQAELEYGDAYPPTAREIETLKAYYGQNWLEVE